MYVSDMDALHRLSRTLKESEFVALDTEFMRERTYYARLCLMQVATDEVVAIVDPLAVDNLSPLFDVLHDPDITKVLHAGHQDLEMLFALSGHATKPVFDTQVAATLAGFPVQVGYGTLVSEIAGVRLDKSDTFTDWARRPLTGTQIEYALNDVRYLPHVYRELCRRLEAEGRLPWLQPEFDRMADPAAYTVLPEEQYLRIKRMRSLKPRQLGVLMKLAAWREREAQRRDIPRRWVIADESLLEIARRLPSDRESLVAVRGVSGKLPHELHAPVLAVVREGLALPSEALPRPEVRPRRSLDVDGAVDLAAALVRARAKEHGVATPLLASRGDLERLAGGEREDSPLLQGWRKQIVGDELVRLLDGELSLRLDARGVVVDEVGDA
ncbi:MAG TPA: ribonuclease D [Coriobacteriia bacterium]|nr:ribonuclease D [Coriobacteriia bacterium]